MVCLEDLITLLTRRAPGDLRGAPARSRGNTTDAEYVRDEEKRDGRSVAEKLLAISKTGAAPGVLEAAAAAILTRRQQTSDAASSASPPGEKSEAAARSPPEQPLSLIHI